MANEILLEDKLDDMIQLMHLLRRKEIYYWDLSTRQNYCFHIDGSISSEYSGHIICPNNWIVDKFYESLYDKALSFIEENCYRTKIHGRKLLISKLYDLSSYLYDDDIINITLYS